MHALKWLYFCSEIPPYVSNKMALFLLGNPTMVYPSNKMALLLHGNPTMVYPNNKMAKLLLGFARLKNCEYKAVILLPVLLG